MIVFYYIGRAVGKLPVCVGFRLMEWGGRSGGVQKSWLQFACMPLLLKSKGQ